MTPRLRVVLCTVLVVAAPFLRAQANESTIVNEIKGLRSLSTTERPLTTIQVARQIQSLPAGEQKVAYADALSNLVTEGDQGQAALQAVAEALTKALAETPIPATGDQPPRPYYDLARLVYYEHATTTLNDPQYLQALKMMKAFEAGIQNADFTLTDLHNQKFTLSELHGKIVLVNFWATWCPPCRFEMGDLDAIYTQFQSQGLVVLSITDDDASEIRAFLESLGYHPPVLLDPGDNVHKMFHVEGIPESFLFGRDGKLVAVAEDQRTQRQFLAMLAQAGLQP